MLFRSINVLSVVPAQRDLIHQYSIPILPFLFLAVISAVADNQHWLKTRRSIIFWAVVGFLLLGKIGYLGSDYLSTLDTRQSIAMAIAKIQDDGAILTTGEIAPHLTHRQIIKLTFNGTETIDLKQFKYVLLECRHPGWNSSLKTIDKIKSRAEASELFNLKYQQDDVYLFAKK